eukprot:TRINITY_DN34824_c0_g1_i1.p1 TRINITY_DN34824_c0_g1~~TRINITY_DN34824_c0_g1_i1.p1  ORF type:complete len:174 (+),score=16.78 TRINITY_DN34824_c0_g1_i1:49-570(+)
MSVNLSTCHLESPNPAHFTDLFQWRIRLEVLEEIDSDLEFKVVWVGSSSSNEYDQILEDCEVGPLVLGANEFILEHDAPNWKLIPPEDLLSVTLVLIMVHYKGQEFCRVAHYVNVAYNQEDLNSDPPEKIHISKVARNVLISKPCVVTKPIDWGTGEGDFSMEKPLETLEDKE